MWTTKSYLASYILHLKTWLPYFKKRTLDKQILQDFGGIYDLANRKNTSGVQVSRDRQQN